MTERFTLLTELGRGGMGVVWKARDEETGQIVALKLLRETYAEDPDYVTRFERELELAKRIHSRNVIAVLGYGVRDRTPYLALEYVDGPSLRERLTDHGPHTWAEARPLLAQITQGLADAQAAGVVHRDLKPSNVLIGSDGVAKLADFGIAKGLDLTRVTGTSTLLGTPAYLAPEGPADERSDLYSLGVIAFEILTGAVPFEGRTYQEVILRHVREAPNLERLPAEARPIVGWLLAKDASDRPQRASDLLPVLWGAAEPPTAPHKPTGALPPSRPEPVSRPDPVSPPVPPVVPVPQVVPAPVAQARPAPAPAPINWASVPALPAPPPEAEKPQPRWTGAHPSGWRADTRSYQAPAYQHNPLGAWLIVGGAAVAALAFVLPWVTVSGSGGSFDAAANYFAGGLGSQYGSAGSVANSLYVLLGAAIAAWLAGGLLAAAGRIPDLKLLLGVLAAAAGVLIVVVMIAVMQTATGMFDQYQAAGTYATISLGTGTLMALAGGTVVILGALGAMATEPNPAPMPPSDKNNPLGAWLIVGGAAVAACSFLLSWVTVASSENPIDAGGSYFAGGLGSQYGSAGSVANSFYLLLAAVVAGWLAWALLTEAGRLRYVRLLLGGLATAAGVLIVVVMIAVMQTATGMYDRHAADGTAATISLGIGTFGALVGGAVVIIGALVAMASAPGEMGRRWLSTWTESWR